MRTNIRPFLRFAAFFLVLALAVALANTCLIQTDTFVALMMDELKNSRDIELAVVGSSIVRDHFNAALISEQTGRKAFSAAVPGLSLQGELALTRELYRQNSPEYTVLVVEPYNFNTAKEDPNAFFKLSPFLSGVQNRLTYFMDACREDGDYLNRLFLFREFGAQSPADVAKTVALRLNAQSEYARLRPTMDSTVAYAGGGFLRHTSGESAETLIRETVLREPDPGYPCELFDASKAFLARYKALCAEKGSHLIVVLSPNLTAHALAEPGFLPYGESLMRYCRENDIPCFNFQYAKAEYLQNLDGYYYDLYHMNGTGADLFSAFFARFFNAYTSGEDVSGWFYADQAQYLASIDRKMCIRDSISTRLSAAHLEKQLGPSCTTPGSMRTRSSWLHLAKASVPTRCTPPGMVSRRRCEQPENAISPICRRLSGRMTRRSAAQPSNARGAMATTGHAPASNWISRSSACRSTQRTAVSVPSPLSEKSITRRPTIAQAEEKR